MDLVDDKMTRKILMQAQEQRKEMDDNGETREGKGLKVKSVSFGGVKKVGFKKRAEVESDEEEGEEEWSEDEEYNELDGVDCKISEEDEAILAKFEHQSIKNTTLADLIMSKLENKENNIEQRPESNLNPKVVEVYSKVGTLLSRYKSGKLPKAFKVIASLKNWEEILYLTKPEDWTVQAMYQATRLFASNLNAKLAQRFYRYVLLDRIRRDIQETKKLNYHLYMALKKCVYKPAAFFKGILIPMLGDGCTLKEAAIVGSVVVKTSIPVLHTAAAILKIIELPYSGAQSLILKYIMDKKYALPFMAIDSLVSYFSR